MTNFSWQGVLFAIALIIVGLAVASVGGQPAWLLPAIGLTFVGGGILTFVMMMQSA